MNDYENPDNWRHLMKKHCASCNKVNNPSQIEYQQRGNYCTECIEKVNEAVASRPKEEENMSLEEIVLGSG